MPGIEADMETANTGAAINNVIPARVGIQGLNIFIIFAIFMI
jgi:hypothetical protein